jgi:hypothetical protein
MNEPVRFARARRESDMSGVRLLLLLGAVLVLPSVPLAGLADNSQGSFKFSVGAEYTTGEYGGDKSVDEWYLPVTGKYLTGPWVFRLTVPYLEVTAPAGTVVSGGQGGDFIVSGSGPRRTESGLGDIIAGVTYQDILDTEQSIGLPVDLTGKIKFGTADEDKGLGTGENDYTVQADAYKYLDAFTPYATLGYRFRGDPDGANLDNGWLYTLGTMYRVSDRVSWSADYYFSEASSSASDDAGELSAGLSYDISRVQKLIGYVIKGVSDGSPDWGAGVLFTIRP